MDDFLQATEDAIVERLQKIEADIADSRDAMCRKIVVSRADMHQTVGGILERLRGIDEVLARLDSKISTARRGTIGSHPIA